MNDHNDNIKSKEQAAFYLLGYAIAMIDDYINNLPECEKKKYCWLKNETEKLIYEYNYKIVPFIADNK